MRGDGMVAAADVDATDDADVAAAVLWQKDGDARNEKDAKNGKDAKNVVKDAKVMQTART